MKSSGVLIAAALALTFSVAAQAGLVKSMEVKSMEKALARADRPAADRARDAGRRPAEVVTFLGIEEGMTVVDLIAAGGWYTEILSIAVGKSGKVYAQNNDYVLKFRDGANEVAISARLAGGRLANVERINAEVSDMGLAPDSVDVVLTALNFHDVVNARGAAAVFGFLEAVKTVLKPEGVFGLIDHDGNPGADNRALHRIPRADALAFLEAAGFELVAEGKMLSNPDDDRTRGVFADGLRGRTDRFVFKLSQR